MSDTFGSDAADDTFAGSGGSDTIYGGGSGGTGGGNDTLTGFGADDTLFGGDGDDQLHGDGVVPQHIERVSTTSAGAQSTGGAVSALSFSADGTKLAFISASNNLVPGDTNLSADVFVKDLATGAITRATLDSDGLQVGGTPTLTRSAMVGDSIVFTSNSNILVAGDTNGVADVFLKNLSTGEVTRLSTDELGTEANGSSSEATLSLDGTKIAFVSNANNLVADDTNGAADIFVKDLSTGVVTLVSTDASGAQSDAYSDGIALSADGTKIAFRSYASNLVAGDSEFTLDYFVKDLTTGAIERVATGIGGAEANGNTIQLSFSPDGNSVVFMSNASDLVADDTNGTADIFVKNLMTGVITRVSTDANGAQANDLSGVDNKFGGPEFSADGTKVVFVSFASNLVAGDTNGARDVFMKDLTTGEIVRLNVSDAGVQTNAVTAGMAVSPAGGTVAIYSNATNLVAGDTNGTTDAFVITLASTAVADDTLFGGAGDDTLEGGGGNDTLDGGDGVDLADYSAAEGPMVVDLDAGTATGDGTDALSGIENVISGAGDDTLTGDGADNALSGGDGDDVIQGGDGVAPQSLVRISVDASGAQANGYSTTAAFSPDGTKLAFRSTASNLVAGDTNGADDIFVKDLVSGEVTRVSTGASGEEANSFSMIRGGAFGDGKVVFTSLASNLVAGDTNGTFDIFVKDIATGAITRVSTDSSGAQIADGSFDAVISADGTKVLFESGSANFVEGDTNNAFDIFVKDLATGVVICVSTNALGVQGDSVSTQAVFSPDGTKVAFWSIATNLVAGDTNNTADVFVKDLVTGEIQRVSTSTAGVQGNNVSLDMMFSADGDKVLFRSHASNLVDGDTNGAQDVFVKDLSTGTLTRVSTDAAGIQGDGQSTTAAFTPDGTGVVFLSEASNLVAGDTNGVADIFLKNLTDGSVTRLSVGDGGEQATFGFSTFVVSSLGTVAAQNFSSNLVDGDTNDGPDVFLITPGGAPTVSNDTLDGGAGDDTLQGDGGDDTLAGGADDDTLDGGDGRDLADYSAATGAIVANLQDGTATGEGDDALSGVEDIDGGAGNDTLTGDGEDNVLSGNGGDDVLAGDVNRPFAITRLSTNAAGEEGIHPSYQPAFSPDGTKIAFVSASPNLVDGDSGTIADIFVKDLATGEVTRVSTDASGVAAGNHSSEPVFSPDGTKIMFVSFASNLVAGDSNGRPDIFVKDLSSGEVVRVSTGSDGTQANNYSQNASFSPDGTRVVFESFANNLVFGDDTNNRVDIFVKDLSTGELTLVSTDGSNIQSNGTSERPVFSPDGTKVLFYSDADNLVPGDTNGFNDLFVKDLNSGEITLVSTDSAGLQLDGNSFTGEFSPDGTKIVFESYATNAVDGDTNDRSDIFIKDLVTGELTRVSTDASGGQANDFSSRAFFSPDGTKIAFVSGATNLVSGDDTNGVEDVFIKDLVTGEVTRMSVNAAGVGGDDFSYEHVFGPDGRSVLFTSLSSNLVAGDTNGGSDVFLASLPLTTVSADTMYGGSGNDILRGYGGADTLYGGADNDALDGGTGNDTMYGGAGDDLYTVDSQDDVASESGGGGADRLRITAGGDYTVGEGIERVISETTSGLIVSAEGTTANTFAGGASYDTVFGGAGDDRLYGGGGIDHLYGGLGNDLLANGAGDGNVFGGAGDDVLQGSAGADGLYGGDDNDTYRIDHVGDISDETGATGSDRALVYVSGVTVGAGIERIDVMLAGGATVSAGGDTANLMNGGAGGDVLDAGDNDDRLYGGDGDDTLYGGAGNDRLYGELGTDGLFGGDGDDLYQLDHVDEVADETGGSGYDTVQLYASSTSLGDGIERIDVMNAGGAIVTVNGSTSVTILGSAAADTLSSADGNDRLFGGDGANTVYGGGGDDRIYGGDGIDVMFAGAGDDRFYGGLGADFFYGGHGNDLYRLDDADDVASETDGSGDDVAQVYAATATIGEGIERIDVMNAGGASITVTGSTAVTLVGSAAADTLAGGGGADRVYGGDGLDTMLGSGGHDRFYGGIGDDIMYGGDGEDRFYGEAGADSFFGGNGDDLYRIDDAQDVADETGGSGYDIAQVYAASATVGEGVERVDVFNAGGAHVVAQGTTENRLYGSAASDTLEGGDGADRLYGGDGVDTLYGGAGNDLLYGDGSADRMFGGDGDDTYRIDHVNDVASEFGASGYDRAQVYSSIGLFGIGMERIDVMAAGGAAIVAQGDTANTIYGSAAADTLFAGDGADRLFGGDGNDWLVGEAGDDTLKGGAGADVFFYSAGCGNDRILDFSAADGDKVDLDGVTFVSAAGRIATLSDSSTITAQAGYVWTGDDFI